MKVMELNKDLVHFMCLHSGWTQPLHWCGVSAESWVLPG